MVSFHDADDLLSTMAKGGDARRFKDVSGIGPKTSEKIMSVRGVRNPSDVADMSADELADKAGISRSRASSAIKAGGGNPSVSKRPTNTGSVSAAGIKTRQGDFMVGFGDLDKARARNDAMSRSKEAVRVDERRRAPITTNYETWKESPGEYDFPGVDTPTQDPQVQTKDYKKGGKPNTVGFDQKGRVEQDKGGGTTDQYPKKKSAPSGKPNFILDTGEERVVASDVAREVPDIPGIAPGMAKEDLESEPETPGRDKTMGWRPAFSRLSKDAENRLAAGAEADMAFDRAERDRLWPL